MAKSIAVWRKAETREEALERLEDLAGGRLPHLRGADSVDPIAVDVAIQKILEQSVYAYLLPEGREAARLAETLAGFVKVQSVNGAAIPRILEAHFLKW